jgi:hypothetical protein
MSDINVIIICASVLAAVGALMWHRKAAMSWRERFIYDLIALFGVTGFAGRLTKAMGQTWFADRLTPMDHAVMIAALVASFILSSTAYSHRQLKLGPLGSVSWIKFYLWRNALYMVFAYAYLTKGTEALLRISGFAATGPVDGLRAAVFVALLAFIGSRIARAVKGIAAAPLAQ